MTHQEFRADVAIVGAGPVGVTLANLLARRGHSIVVFDKSLEIYALPRAAGLDHESMRVFQNLGLAEAMSPYIEPYRPSEYRNAEGAVLRRLLPAPEPFPLSWPPNLTFIQPDVERLLRTCAGSFPNLELRLGWEVVAAAGLDSEPFLEAVSISGTRERWVARYVVGCDGGASFLRKMMAAPLEDLGFDEPWLVVDMLLTEPVALPEVNIQFCNPARPTTYVRGPGVLRRWEFMLLPGEVPAEAETPDNIWRLLKPWLNPTQAKIWRAASYRFHALVAEQWRRGRAFLAGDAAHQTPPFLAQGLNQGIRDAVNLSWKLSAVLDGAPEALLDSYEAERRPNVRAVISLTKSLGQEICECDAAKVEARDRRLLADFAAGKGVKIRQDLLPPLRNALTESDRRGTPRPGEGELLPQPWIRVPEGRRRLDDMLDNGLRLIVTSSFDCTGVRATLQRLSIKAARLAPTGTVCATTPGELPLLFEEDALLEGWMRSRHCEAVLVRPDHVVYAAVRDAGELEEALARLSEALGKVQTLAA